MIRCIRTDSSNADFQKLVRELDAFLHILDGEEHSFYAQFNKIDLLKHAIVAYSGDEPVGCGAIKENAPGIMEVKRMYVAQDHRKKGIASAVLTELESWAKELGYSKCILETGRKQPEAISLYKKSGYQEIPNFGQYLHVDNSVCFEKQLA